MSSIITSILKKTGVDAYADPVNFGTRPAYISASQGVSLSNLEEQMYLGPDTYTTSWEDEDEDSYVERIEYRDPDSDAEFYYTERHTSRGKGFVVNVSEASFEGTALQFPRAEFDTTDGTDLHVSEMYNTRNNQQQYEYVVDENGDTVLKISNSYNDRDKETVTEYILLCYCDVNKVERVLAKKDVFKALTENNAQGIPVTMKRTKTTQYPAYPLRDGFTVTFE